MLTTYETTNQTKQTFSGWSFSKLGWLVCIDIKAVESCHEEVYIDFFKQQTEPTNMSKLESLLFISYMII